MFCPKCGTKNPSDGKFCRKCGIDLEIVSAAVAGELRAGVKYNEENQRERSSSWDSAINKFSIGLAFLVIAAILGITNVIGGSYWWFWMLIPAFAMIGTGIAQTIQLRENPQSVSTKSAKPTKQVSSKKQNALPPTQTDYVSPFPNKHKTGDLAPSSVVENTTRHLEMNSENETENLQKDNG